ncbi:MAG: CBS domain-containing protein [Spirochaetales bacterium]|nr:CBS domain-containing protein [Spirochaetales bacterium]
MELFIDSVELSLIEEYFSLSIFKGITTTPTFFLRNGIMNYENEIKKILEIGNAQVHIEAMGTTVDEIVQSAKRNSAIGDNIVSKIPVSKNGIRAVKALKDLGIRTNIHLIFSVNQAILAARSGADYICPLLGRLHDIGINAFQVLEDIIHIIKTYHLDVKVMASSIRSPDDVKKACIAGVHAITIPPFVLKKMFHHPLTGTGIEKFSQDILYSRQVNEVMKTRDELPLLEINFVLYDALAVMTQKKIGIVIIVDKTGKLKGIVTDGDIRRILNNSKDNINKKVSEIMNKNPKVIKDSIYIAEALKIMEQNRITALIVVNDSQVPIGYLNIHDILPHTMMGEI